MNDGENGPTAYKVSYSTLVRAELLKLTVTARQSGWGPEILAAVREIDERLRIYPEFGEPLCDLKLVPAQLWIGVVPPLVVRYTLDHARRVVMVTSPFLALRRPANI